MVLADQLAQLLLGVGEKLRVVFHVVHKGQLGPHHQAGAVAEVAPGLRLLVMRLAVGRRPDLADQVEVLALVRLADGPALVRAVLVAVDAVQIEITAVEEETTVRIHLEVAQAEREHDGIAQRLPGEYLRAHLVKVGIGQAIPQVRLWQHEPNGRLDAGAGREGSGVFDDSYRVPRGIEHGETNSDLTGRFAVVGQSDQCVQLRRFGRDFRLPHIDPRRGVIEQVEMHAFGRDQADGAIQSAEKREVRADRHHVVVWIVVHAHREQVLAGEVQHCRGIEAETGEAAAMRAKPAAVKENLRTAICAVELQIDLLPRPAPLDAKMPAIPAVAAVVIAATVLPIARIPGMRKADAFPGGVVKARRRGLRLRAAMEFPTGRQDHLLSRRRRIHLPGGKDARREEEAE